MHTMQRVGLAAATVAVLGSAVVGTGPGAQAASQGKAPFTFAVIGDIPYGDAQIAALPRWSTRSTPTRPSLRRPPRRHQERLVGVQRRVLLDDPHAVRPLQDPLVYTPGRQRVDRLPPRQQRRLQPARAARRRPADLLRPARAARWASTPVGGDSQAGRGLPGERHAAAGRRRLRGRCTSSGSNNGLGAWTGQDRADAGAGGRGAARTAADIAADPRDVRRRAAATTTEPSCC